MNKKAEKSVCTMYFQIDEDARDIVNVFSHILMVS